MHPNYYKCYPKYFICWCLPKYPKVISRPLRYMLSHGTFLTGLITWCRSDNMTLIFEFTALIKQYKWTSSSGSLLRPKRHIIFRTGSDRAQSLSHLKRTAPGFVWKRTKTTSPAGSRTGCLVRTRVRCCIHTSPKGPHQRCFWFGSNQTRQVWIRP